MESGGSGTSTHGKTSISNSGDSDPADGEFACVHPGPSSPPPRLVASLAPTHSRPPLPEACAAADVRFGPERLPCRVMSYISEGFAHERLDSSIAGEPLRSHGHVANTDRPRVAQHHVDPDRYSSRLQEPGGSDADVL